MGLERSLPDDIGRYRVVRLLGQGAMGRVFLAHDPVLDRDVAVKLLRDDLGLPAEHRLALLERMRQEARASARVSHPYIVALHDMGEDAELGLFLVFEYAEGITLKERLARGALTPDAVAKLARPVGSALSTAHEAGVVHRDIKPENIILTKSGPKIADFGIARVPDSTLTRDGGLLGTPAYSAPEAIADGSFSPLSDQFSLATTLWEAITGRRAFPGDDAVAVASRIATDEPPKIAELCGLNPHVDTVLARGLSKNPRGRFTSCEEFTDALADALGVPQREAMPTLPDRHHREVIHHPAPAPQQEIAPVRPGTRWVPGLAVGVVVGGGLALGAYSLTRSAPEDRPLPDVEPRAEPVLIESAPAAPTPPMKKTKAVAVASSVPDAAPLPEIAPSASAPDPDPSVTPPPSETADTPAAEPEDAGAL